MTTWSDRVIRRMQGVTYSAPDDEGMDDDVQGVLNAEVAGRLLRYHLVRFREAAGIKQTEAANRIDRKQPTIASMETGKALPTQSNVEVLLNYYGAADSFPMMKGLLAAARTKAPNGDLPPVSTVEDFTLAVGLEPFARKIEVFEPSVLHGFMQTEDYARALIGYQSSITAGMDVEAAVEWRMQRQEAITRESEPADFWMFCEERAIRRLVGGSALMVAQWRHLVEMTHRPNVTIQIVSDDVALHPALAGAFYLLGFKDGWRVAYEETHRSAYYYNASDAVDAYSRCVDHLRHVAMTPAESVSLIEQLIREVTVR